MSDSYRPLAKRDGRYAPEAFRFLFDSLDRAVQLAGKEHAEGSERHVTGQEVLRGLCENARAAFGPLAAQVWRSWGVREPMDWGRIVFTLVDAQMLKRQEGDTIEDFEADLDFEELFVRDYRADLSGLGPGRRASE